MMMNRPVIRSVTSDCAPKPMARPMTPAPASSGVTFMPMLASATMMAITAMVAMMVLRISGSMVSARTLARFLPPVPRACCKAVSVRIQISQATSMVPTKLAARGPNCEPPPSIRPASDMPSTRRPISTNSSRLAM